MADVAVTNKTTTQRLATEIAEIARVDPRAYAQTTLFIDARGAKWRWNHPAPPKPEVLVFYIVREEDDVLVYCAPTSAKDADGQDLSYMRFVLSRSSGTMVVDSMPTETFKREISAHLRQSKDGLTSGEREREAVLDYLRAIPVQGYAVPAQGYSIAEIISDIEEEVHLDEYDDREDPGSGDPQVDAAPEGGQNPG